MQKEKIMVETFILNTDPLDNKELFEQLLEQVDDTRKEKILKLRTFTKQKQSLGAGLLIKKYVGDVHSLNKNGKPKNNDTEFNISHSGKYVVLTKGGTEPVGVDIELMQRGNKHIAPRFFTLDECVQIDRSYDPDKTFTQIWTLKEAFLKCIGSGVGKDLKRFTIHIDDEKIRIDNRINRNIYYFKEYDISGYKLSVCSEDNRFAETLEDVTDEIFKLEETK